MAFASVNGAIAGASDDQMPDDEQEPLLLMDLPPDALHAIARQLVCVGPHAATTAKDRFVACDAEEKLFNSNADGHKSPPPRRCSGWACALTSLSAVQHMTTLCTGLRSTLLADEVLWSMLRRRRRDVLAASAPLASLPRLTPDAVSASLCSAHIVPHGTPLSMPLSDAIEIETWQASEEQASHCRRRALSNARTHPTHPNPLGARVAVRARRTGRRPRVAGQPPRAQRGAGRAEAASCDLSPAEVQGHRVEVGGPGRGPRVSMGLVTAIARGRVASAAGGGPLPTPTPSPSPSPTPNPTPTPTPTPNPNPNPDP